MESDSTTVRCACTEISSLSQVNYVKSNMHVLNDRDADNDAISLPSVEGIIVSFKKTKMSEVSVYVS